MKASIQEIRGKIKRFIRTAGEPDVFTALVVILVAFLAFGLGRLSILESKKSDIRIETIPVGEAGALGAAAITAIAGKPPASAQSTQGQFVASKNGAKYYFPWCSGANRIKDENKVWFQTVGEAKKAGYQPASTCKGL